MSTNTTDTIAPAAATSSPAAQPTLAKHDDNLIWLDCEMSGLDPEKERLLEIAVIVTSPDLSVRIAVLGDLRSAQGRRDHGPPARPD